MSDDNNAVQTGPAQATHRAGSPPEPPRNATPLKSESRAVSNISGASGHVLDCHGAWVQVHARSVATVLKVGGEIDAANVEHLGASLRRFVSLRDAVIVDVGAVEFISLQGVRQLFVFNRECHSAGILWALVPGKHVDRILHAAHLPLTLPTVDSVVEAIHQFVAARRDRAQLLHSLVSRRRN